LKTKRLFIKTLSNGSSFVVDENDDWNNGDEDLIASMNLPLKEEAADAATAEK
jgi:hypothetical protein